MAFLAPVVAAIAGVGSAVASVAAPVIAGIGSAAAAVGGAIASGAGAVGSFLSSAAGEVASGVASVASAVTGGLGKTASDVANAVSDVTGPVSSVLNTFGAAFDTINNDIVKPILDPIQNTYTSVNNLINVLHGDLSAGIQGLIKLPGDLSNALTSVDASFGRATAQLGSQNKDIATSIFEPTLTRITAEGLTPINATLADRLTPAYESVGQFDTVHLTEPNVTDALQTSWTRWLSKVQEGKTWIDKFWQSTIDALFGVPWLLETLVPGRERTKQEALSKLPTSLLGLGDVVRAKYRGILSESDADAEALKHGLNPGRLQVLMENQGWLPSAREALELFYRQQIDEATMIASLEKQGFSRDDISALQKSFLEPINPREAILTYARQGAASQGFLTATLASSPSQALTDLYAYRFRRPETSIFDWTNHWRVPEMSWWITAYYRGLVDLNTVEHAAQALMVPPELINDLISVEGETIQQWMIPDILAAGLMSEAEAINYTRYIGMGERDAKVLVQYGLSKVKAPVAAQAADLMKISVGNARTMFDDGLIDQATYAQVLVSHGYGEESTKLTVALAAQEQALAARKSTAQALVDQANSGLISDTTVETQLYALGYTDAEVVIWMNKVRAAKVAKARVPSASEFKSAWKHQLIDDAEYLQALELLGYSQQWATLLVDLAKAGG